MSFYQEEARYRDDTVQDDKCWKLVAGILTSQEDPFHICTIGLLKAIINNITFQTDDTRVNYPALADSYVAYFWTPVVQVGLWHTPREKTGDNTNNLVSNRTEHEPSSESPLQIFPEMIRFANHSLRDIDVGYAQVPIEGKKLLARFAVNVGMGRAISEIYAMTDGLLYSYSNIHEWIRVNPNMLRFLTQNKTILDILCNLYYAKALQELNPDYEFIELLWDIDVGGIDSSHANYRYFFEMYTDMLRPYGFDLGEARTKFFEYSSFQMDSYEDAALLDRICNFDLSAVRDIPDVIRPVNKPSGTPHNGKRSIERDARISAHALVRAKFRCEIDPSHETFTRRKDGIPYTEPHHLVPMSFSSRFSVSLDVEANIVSLCPSCHRELHSGVHAKDLLIRLYQKRSPLLEEAGIHVTLEQLLQMYGL